MSTPPDDRDANREEYRDLATDLVTKRRIRRAKIRSKQQSSMNHEQPLRPTTHGNGTGRGRRRALSTSAADGGANLGGSKVNSLEETKESDLGARGYGTASREEEWTDPLAMPMDRSRKRSKSNTPRKKPQRNGARRRLPDRSSPPQNLTLAPQNQPPNEAGTPLNGGDGGLTVNPGSTRDSSQEATGGIAVIDIAPPQGSAADGGADLGGSRVNSLEETKESDPRAREYVATSDGIYLEVGDPPFSKLITQIGPTLRTLTHAQIEAALYDAHQKKLAINEHNGSTPPPPSIGPTAQASLDNLVLDGSFGHQLLWIVTAGVLIASYATNRWLDPNRSCAQIGLPSPRTNATGYSTIDFHCPTNAGIVKGANAFLLFMGALFSYDAMRDMWERSNSPRLIIPSSALYGGLISFVTAALSPALKPDPIFAGFIPVIGLVAGGLLTTFAQRAAIHRTRDILYRQRSHLWIHLIKQIVLFSGYGALAYNAKVDTNNINTTLYMLRTGAGYLTHEATIQAIFKMLALFKDAYPWILGSSVFLSGLRLLFTQLKESKRLNLDGDNTFMPVLEALDLISGGHKYAAVAPVGGRKETMEVMAALIDFLPEGFNPERDAPGLANTLTRRTGAHAPADHNTPLAGEFVRHYNGSRALSVAALYDPLALPHAYHYKPLQFHWAEALQKILRKGGDPLLITGAIALIWPIHAFIAPEQNAKDDRYLNPKGLYPHGSNDTQAEFRLKSSATNIYPADIELAFNVVNAALLATLFAAQCAILKAVMTRRNALNANLVYQLFATAAITALSALLLPLLGLNAELGIWEAFISTGIAYLTTQIALGTRLLESITTDSIVLVILYLQLHSLMTYVFDNNAGRPPFFVVNVMLTSPNNPLTPAPTGSTVKPSTLAGQNEMAENYGTAGKVMALEASAYLVFQAFRAYNNRQAGEAAHIAQDEALPDPEANTYLRPVANGLYGCATVVGRALRAAGTGAVDACVAVKDRCRPRRDQPREADLD